MRRESYSNRFATALEGVDIDNPGTRARPLRPSQSGAARRRQDPPQASGRGRRREVPARQHRRARSRSPCPARSRCRSRRRTISTRTRRRWRSTTPPPSTRRSRTCSPPAPTSCRSTSPTCRRGRRRRGKYGLKALNARARRRQGHDRGAHLLRLRRDHPRAARGLFVPAGARRLAGAAGLDRDRAVEPRLLGAGEAAGQDRSCSACSTCPT